MTVSIEKRPSVESNAKTKSTITCPMGRISEFGPCGDPARASLSFGMVGGRDSVVFPARMAFQPAAPNSTRAIARAWMNL